MMRDSDFEKKYNREMMDYYNRFQVFSYSGQANAGNRENQINSVQKSDGAEEMYKVTRYAEVSVIRSTKTQQYQHKIFDRLVRSGRSRSPEKKWSSPSPSYSSSSSSSSPSPSPYPSSPPAYFQAPLPPKCCPYCGKCYLSPPALAMHLKTHYRVYQCPKCGKKFSRPWLLHGHIRTHTGEKPYKCFVCGKAFADKSNLRAHEQTHSPHKPYTCQICMKGFALKSYLYKHEDANCVRSGHQEAPIDFSNNGKYSY